MKQLVITDAHHLTLQEDLANALAQSKKLSVVGMAVMSCDVKAVTTLANSPSLQALHIYTRHLKKGLTELGVEGAELLCSSLRQSHKRPIDLKITIGLAGYYRLLEGMKLPSEPFIFF